MPSLGRRGDLVTERCNIERELLEKYTRRRFDPVVAHLRLAGLHLTTPVDPKSNLLDRLGRHAA